MADLNDIIEKDDSQNTIDALKAIDRYYQKVMKVDMDGIKEQIKDLELDVSNVKDKQATMKTDIDTIKAKQVTMKFDMDNLKEDREAKLLIADKITNTLLFKQIDTEVHDRKWSIDVFGVPGLRNEPAFITRQKIMEIAAVFSDWYIPAFAACHRISSEPSSPIILVFMDLDEKNYWLENAFLLKKYNEENETKVGISQNLPPAIKPIVKNLMNKKSALNQEQKRKCSVTYIGKFPYMYLKFARALKKESIFPDDKTRDEVIKYVLYDNLTQPPKI